VTLPSTLSRNNYVGLGTLSVYTYSYRIFSETSLLVTRMDTAGVEFTLVLTTDYTVQGVGDAAGGTITLQGGEAPLPLGHTLSIRRVRPLTQLTDIRNQGPYFAALHEDTFDKLTMVDQQQQDEIDRSYKLPESEDPDDFEVQVPTCPIRANKFFAWDADGNPIARGGTGAGAPVDAQYVVTALNGTLTSERLLTAGAGISIVDGGANGPVTVAATGSAGITLQLNWRFDTGTADADPGSKRFRFNNATQPSATFIFVNDISNSNLDATAILSALPSGTLIYLQRISDATQFHLATTTGVTVDGGGYWKIPITISASGVAFLNNQDIGWIIFALAGGTTFDPNQVFPLQMIGALM
jgi:hypothetical protein